jgi:hypothetical protein
VRVLGALYGVTLVVSSDEEPSSTPDPQPKSSRKRQAAGNRASDAPADETQPAPKRRRASRTAGSPDNAEVRSWARQNGMAVSGRGRVPASVMRAFREAHAE